MRQSCRPSCPMPLLQVAVHGVVVHSPSEQVARHLGRGASNGGALGTEGRIQLAAAVLLSELTLQESKSESARTQSIQACLLCRVDLHRHRLTHTSLPQVSQHFMRPALHFFRQIGHRGQCAPGVSML